MLGPRSLGDSYSREVRHDRHKLSLVGGALSCRNSYTRKGHCHSCHDRVSQTHYLPKPTE